MINRIEKCGLNSYRIVDITYAGDLAEQSAWPGGRRAPRWTRDVLGAGGGYGYFSHLS